VLGNDADMARLEALVHPLVERARLAFLRKVRHTAVVQALVATSLAAPPPTSCHTPSSTNQAPRACLAAARHSKEMHTRCTLLCAACGYWCSCGIF
jgi:hypothetical protein